MRLLIPAFLISLVAQPLAAAPADPASVFADIKRDEPGCAAAVLLDGRTAWSGGFGSADLARSKPITADTVFNIASDSKQFTAFSILLLAKDGKLDLDDPIRKYLPELGAHADPVTIRMLIHHTGGLQDYMFLANLAGIPTTAKMTEQQTYDFVVAQKAAEFPAGTEFSYSNTGYFLLSMIVERVTGGTNKAFVESRILRPLGMSASSLVDKYPDGIAALARGYAKADQGYRIDESLWENTGDGQVHATVKDALLWESNLESGALGGRALADEMRQVGTLANGTKLDYAYGLVIAKYRGAEVVSHSGGWAGYNSHLLWLPAQHFAAAVFCNSYGRDPGKRAEKLADLFVGDRLEPADATAPDPALVAAAKLAPDAIRPGIYASPLGGVATIARKDGGLVLTIGEESGTLTVAGGNLVTTKLSEGPIFMAAPAPGQVRFDADTLYTLLPAGGPGNVTRFAGRYLLGFSPGGVDVTVKDGALVAKVGAETAKLRPIGPNVFDCGGWGTITFAEDGNSFTASFLRGAVFRRG